MARLEPEAAAAAPTRVDIGKLLTSVIDDLRPLASERRIRVTASASSDCIVAGNEDSLRILFSNLVDNAIRYTPEGGTVNTAVRREGADVEATLEDNGPGIPEDERARVFDRFYRGPTATATGTGLGLAIVSQVVEMHRGSVALGTSGAGGLQVRVRIPA